MDIMPTFADDITMLNLTSKSLFDQIADPETAFCQRERWVQHSIAGATILDCGVNTHGSIAAGIRLAKLCLAGLADVKIVPCDPDVFVSSNAVMVVTDHPVKACLGSQYAGWPVSAGKYFAMGSGPMRAARGREEILTQLDLVENANAVVGILESDQLPSEEVVELVAGDCGVSTECVGIAIAPSTSIAGSVQVVARAIETALHKLHELEFDVQSVQSAVGVAPLSPCAKPGDTIGGIGRTNDAVLYGATVTLWVDSDDEAIERVAEKVPSCSSSDYGKPFTEVFKQYDYDFYKVDPLLFSPARVTIQNLSSGRIWNSGSLNTSVLRKSFSE